MEGKNHSEALLLKKPRQSILVPSGSQVEDNFNRKLVEEWLGAGLPLKVLSQPSFRSFFETAISRKIPSVSQLYTKYADTVYAEKQSTLLHLVKSFRSYYVMFDEADYNGEKYYALLIGNLNAEGAHQPYLIELSREMKTPDAVAVQQKVIQLLSKVGLLTSEDAFNKFRLFLTDGASYCTSAGREIKKTFPFLSPPT